MKNLALLMFLLMSAFGYAQITLPIDFESTTISYTFTDFDGGQMTVENNPDMSGINTSTKVARMIKNAGQPWGGSFLELAAPIDFSAGKHFKMKVWSPNAGRSVLLKVENLTNGAISYEQQEMTTTGNAWEEIVFDFTGVNEANSYQKLVFIFDLGTMGDGSANFTFYVDDIELFEGGNGLAQVDLPITFEDTATVDYALVDFGGNASSIVEDPTDPTNLVGKAIKTNMAELWAGTTNGGNGLASPIPFTAANTKMTVRVWSPDANTPIRLKVEDATDPTVSVETEVNTTMAGAWETLEFDFSNQAPGTAALNLANTYDKVSIFFNFGTTGAMAGEKTYYWDDVRFGGLVNAQDIKASEAGIKIYPNPASDFCTIEFPEAINGDIRLSVFDVNGKLVKGLNLTRQQSAVDMSGLNQGAYYLRIETGLTSYFQKLMIAR